MKSVLALLLSFATVNAYSLDANKQLTILQWLRPLMGDQALSGALQCSKIRFWNTENRWDRFAQISFNIGIANDTLYHPARHPDENCKITESGSRSQLRCQYLSVNGLLGLLSTRTDIVVTKRGNTLEGFQFSRRSADFRANYSADCGSN